MTPTGGTLGTLRSGAQTGMVAGSGLGFDESGARVEVSRKGRVSTHPPYVVVGLMLCGDSDPLEGENAISVTAVLTENEIRRRCLDPIPRHAR